MLNKYLLLGNYGRVNCLPRHGVRYDNLPIYISIASRARLGCHRQRPLLAEAQPALRVGRPQLHGRLVGLWHQRLTKPARRAQAAPVTRVPYGTNEGVVGSVARTNHARGPRRTHACTYRGTTTADLGCLYPGLRYSSGCCSTCVHSDTVFTGAPALTRSLSNQQRQQSACAPACVDCSGQPRHRVPVRPFSPFTVEQEGAKAATVHVISDEPEQRLKARSACDRCNRHERVSAAHRGWVSSGCQPSTRPTHLRELEARRKLLQQLPHAVQKLQEDGRSLSVVVVTAIRADARATPASKLMAKGRPVLLKQGAEAPNGTRVRIQKNLSQRTELGRAVPAVTGQHNNATSTREHNGLHTSTTTDITAARRHTDLQCTSTETPHLRSLATRAPPVSTIETSLGHGAARGRGVSTRSTTSQHQQQQQEAYAGYGSHLSHSGLPPSMTFRMIRCT